MELARLHKHDGEIRAIITYKRTQGERRERKVGRGRGKRRVKVKGKERKRKRREGKANG